VAEEVVETNLAPVLHHNPLAEMVEEVKVLTVQVVNLEVEYPIIFYLLLVLQTPVAVEAEEHNNTHLLLIILVLMEHLVQLVDLV
tara:strand:- start:70 stop:324 length:255 start_codon:yes stop_codon:yes gene_type:complete